MPSRSSRASRRSLAGRGRGAGGLCDSGRALATGRHAALARSLDRHDGEEPRHRPDPPRADVRPQGRAPGAAAGRTWRRGRRRELDPRRAARAPVHVLPPGARRRGADRAHAPRGRRADDAGDRPRVPRRRVRRWPSGSSARSVACAMRGSRFGSLRITSYPTASRTSCGSSTSCSTRATPRHRGTSSSERSCASRRSAWRSSSAC